MTSKTPPAKRAATITRENWTPELRAMFCRGIKDSTLEAVGVLGMLVPALSHIDTLYDDELQFVADRTAEVRRKVFEELKQVEARLLTIVECSKPSAASDGCDSDQ